MIASLHLASPDGAEVGFFGPRRLFLGLFTVGKDFSLPWVGPALNSFSSTHGQSPKQAVRPVQGLICLHQRGQGLKKGFSPARGLFFYLATYHDQKAFLSADRAFSGPFAARISVPRARDVETKALLIQRRVLKGRLVLPLPQRGLSGPCGGLQMGPEAIGTNEASRRAENTLTGHTRLFLFLDKASSRRAGIARVFLRLCVLSVACFSSKQSPSNSQIMQGSITVTQFPGSGFRPWRVRWGSQSLKVD